MERITVEVTPEQFYDLINLTLSQYGEPFNHDAAIKICPRLQRNMINDLKVVYESGDRIPKTG